MQVFNNLIYQPQTLIIAVFMILATFFVLWAISLPTALVSLVVPLKRVSTLFSSVFGGILFHERHLFRKMVATFGMIGGILLIVL